MVPDLPVELWLYIISMLPRGHLYKLVGVNRTLFSLAMGEIYGEVRFMDDDQVMRKTFHQLKYPSIARRVQHVYIRPGFFAKMERVTEPKLSVIKRLRANIFRLGRRKTLQPAVDPQEDILLVAGCGLANCMAVEELTIILHDLLPPPTFSSFVTTIWVSMAPNLRRLTLDATLPKLALLLDPAILQNLPNLTDLKISITISRFSSRPKRDPCIIRPFLNSLTKTLISLTILSEIMDLTNLFYGLGHFPLLQTLSIHTAMNRLTFKVPYLLAKFITLHKDTLQVLTIVPLDAMLLRNELSYRVWVTQVFCGLDLPALQSLDIGLSMGFPFSDTIIPPLYSTRLPRLVSLILSDAYMSYDDIEATFGNNFNGNRLESLQIRVEELNPQVLYLLAERLLHLTSLDMTFERRSVEILPIHDTYDSYDLDFEHQMSNCKLPNWNIRNLKLSRVYWRSCPLPHYELRTMEIVAGCLPSPVTLGIQNECICICVDEPSRHD
ncbi:hypothetical protein BDZ94DRAFT_1294927 [Collybia nuda]|uniref:F-box domain-containing protein n=1 Tax=Collybia nuda TaxID=64659 RepID=A0A9P6CIP2_9AGAR|nr:hypothetical protein BDZ94DRAFT_1294927 [Collybia nuda]